MKSKFKIWKVGLKYEKYIEFMVQKYAYLRYVLLKSI